MFLRGIVKQGATPVWEGTAVASRDYIHRSSVAQVRIQLDAIFIILSCIMLVCKYCDNQFGISGSIDKKGTKKMIGR
jgi:hypothetical protein